MFRMFVDLNQCRHIFFAGCHDTGFNSLLTPHRGSDKITLIKAASWHRDFENYGLPIKELPSVFMSTPLSTTTKPPTGPLGKAINGINTANSINGANGTITNGNSYKPVCKHYQKVSFAYGISSQDLSNLIYSQGICRFGNSCIKQHVMPDQQLSKPAPESPKKLWSTPTIVGRSLELFSTTLPSKGKESEEIVPINKDGDRLDAYCPHPSADAMDRYHRRAKDSKVCNSYHLCGECGDMSCPYDHSDVPDTIIEVLRYLSLQHPCPKGGACRSIKCHLGHICQKPNCKAVKSWQCRFNHRAHTLDLTIEKWVASVEQTDDEKSRSPSTSDESVGGTSSRSLSYV